MHPNDSRFGYKTFRTADAFTPVDGVVVTTKKAKLTGIFIATAVGPVDIYDQGSGALVAGNLKLTIPVNTIPSLIDNLAAYFPNGITVKALTAAGAVSGTLEEFN